MAKKTKRQQRFADAVAAFASVAERRLLFVFQQSFEDTVTYMQKPVAKGGNMPVDTGFLRNSLRVTLNAPDAAAGTLPKPADGSKGVYIDPSVTISSAKLTDTIYATYLANYAVHQEYGSNGRAGRAFVRQAALQFPKLVFQNVKKSRSIK